MYNPFINASELTEEELHEKIQKCTVILYQETHWGHTQMVDSARAALDVYQAELDERLFRRLHDIEVAKNPYRKSTNFDVRFHMVQDIMKKYFDWSTISQGLTREFAELLHS